MTLKELRNQIGITQPEASILLGIPLRTYCRYEKDAKYENSFKYKQMYSILFSNLDTTILKIERLKEIVEEVCQKHKIDACYLFGSYAKGKATADSDIDLMIVSKIEGIEFYEVISELESKTLKKVDLLKLDVAIQNVKLMNEILKDAIKIFG